MRTFLENFTNILISHFPESSFKSVYIDNNISEFEIQVDFESLEKVLLYLKTESTISFEQLTDITIIDKSYPSNMFKIIYNVLSLTKNVRLQMTTYINYGTIIPSIHSIYKSAVWYEREIWDLFGIGFSNHPDLRRLLTPTNFDGYPLHKDFPLEGFKKIYLDEKFNQLSLRENTTKPSYRVGNNTGSSEINDQSR